MIAVLYTTTETDRSIRQFNYNVLVIDKVSPELISILKSHGFRVSYRPGISLGELYEIIRDYHVLVLRGRLRVDEKVLSRAEKLKVIARAGVGLDNIDVIAAENRGIRVVNAPEASMYSVAELTIMLMLAAARRLGEALDMIRRGEWRKITGLELYGKTLSVIGFGRIGSRVAEIAKAMGMRVVAYDVRDLTFKAKSMGVVFVDDLYKALSQGDVVSIHVPLTPKTRRMISFNEFKAMKKGIIFINTSRGAVVDTKALLWALEEGIVAAAGLDVLEHEPPVTPEEKRLISHPRVIVTPHIGAQTIEAQKRIAYILARKIIEVLRDD